MDSTLLQKLAVITPEERLLLLGGTLDKGNYATGNAFTVDSQRMLEKGQLIAVRPHTRFTFFPQHSHNYVEMMYMCSGKTVHLMNAAGSAPTAISLQAGELLLMNQHAGHAIERAEVEDIAVNFIILPQFFHTAFDMIGTDNVLGRFLLGSMQASTPAPGYLHFATSGVLPVQNLLENMVWTLVHKTKEARRMNQYTMGVLFLHLLGYTRHLEASAVHSPCVQAALNEIEENYATASLTAVAKAQRVSSAYVSGLVRTETGSTFTTLLQQKRLARAAQLLHASPLSIQSIIEAVGYDNSSYFYRLFRESFGISPKEYRKNTALLR